MVLSCLQAGKGGLPKCGPPIILSGQLYTNRAKETGALQHNECKSAQGHPCDSPNGRAQYWKWNEHLLIFQKLRSYAAELKRRHQAGARVYTGYSTSGGGRIQPCTPFVVVQGISLNAKRILAAQVWLANCCIAQ